MYNFVFVMMLVLILANIGSVCIYTHLLKRSLTAARLPILQHILGEEPHFIESYNHAIRDKRKFTFLWLPLALIAFGVTLYVWITNTGSSLAQQTYLQVILIAAIVPTIARVYTNPIKTVWLAAWTAGMERVLAALKFHAISAKIKEVEAKGGDATELRRVRNVIKVKAELDEDEEKKLSDLE